MHDLFAGNRVISTILRHDAKQTSYKIALIRASNDVVLAYVTTIASTENVAVPLRFLAEWWFAYYFPFMDRTQPILQGPRSQRNGKLTADLSFRRSLTDFRILWEQETQLASMPADGFFVVSEFRRIHRRRIYSAGLETLYQQAIGKISEALEMPIRYAGQKGSEWAVFAKPQPYNALSAWAVALPGTQPEEKCLYVSSELWQSFVALSLWIEALCIHEWCLFTEQVEQEGGIPARRGAVYELLTARPDNRRPLTWERNQVDILLMEGEVFHCPWTHRLINSNDYDLDHLIPLAVYPVNDLWNLVPSDPRYNRHQKRDRLPSTPRLVAATPMLIQTYGHHQRSPVLDAVLQEDATLRFRDLTDSAQSFEQKLTTAVITFIDKLSAARNVATF